MGYSQAYGYAESVQSGLIGLDVALLAHLSSNHFPPIPSYMVPVAKQAIKLILLDEPYTEIDLPNGVTSQRHGTSVPADAVAEELHLYPFVGQFQDADLDELFPEEPGIEVGDKIRLLDSLDDTAGETGHLYTAGSVLTVTDIQDNTLICESPDYGTDIIVQHGEYETAEV